jgi:antitoxin (DNA-binding transcriptional repressor) of toxin-antitoxin stability system
MGSARPGAKDLLRACRLTMWHKMCHDGAMPNMNIRQLRDTKQLKAWLRAGKTVELRERDKVIGRIVPVASPTKTRKIPDFAAMRREIIGDRILPGADLLIEERERSRY